LKYLFLSLLFLPYAYSADNNQLCDVQINVEIPKFKSTYEFAIIARREHFPISPENPSLCLSHSQVGTYPKIFSNKQIQLVLKSANEQVTLFSTHVHQRTKSVLLNSYTHMISKACGLNCGFSEYNALLNNDVISKLSSQYTEKALKAENSIFKKSHLENQTLAISEQAQNFYQNLIRRKAKLTPGIHRTATELMSAGYSTEIWNGFANKGMLFGAAAKPRISAFKKKQKELERNEYQAAKAALKPFQKRVRALFTQRQPWPDKSKNLLVLADRMSKSNHNAPRQYAEIIKTSVSEINDRYHDFLNNGDIAFRELTNKNMKKEEVLAHLFRLAFHHSENKKIAHTLFSTKLKQATIESHERRSNNFFSIKSIFDRFMISSRYLNDFERFLFDKFANEYASSAKREGDKIYVSNELEKFSVIFEKGAWRLDSFDFRLKR